MPDEHIHTNNAGRTRALELPGNRTLDFTGMPLVMGIINGTPDSFYPESRHGNLESGLSCATSMIEEGADILDIGGESSRPGSDYVDAKTEIERIVPLIREIRALSDIPISVDTRKAMVAAEAIHAGADIVNDISGLRDDEELGSLVASLNVPVIIMHMRGTPKTMQKNPSYTSAVHEIKDELEILANSAIDKGIRGDRIILDPGIGFGKRLEDNIAIVAGAEQFRSLGFPVLFGASRKSFIGTITGRDVEDRFAGSLAIAVLLSLSAADILRVHDVGATVDALNVVAAVRADGD